MSWLLRAPPRKNGQNKPCRKRGQLKQKHKGKGHHIGFRAGDSRAKTRGEAKEEVERQVVLCGAVGEARRAGGSRGLKHRPEAPRDEGKKALVGGLCLGCRLGMGEGLNRQWLTWREGFRTPMMSGDQVGGKKLSRGFSD